MTSYRDIAIPTALAARLQEAQRLPDRPATLGEYVGVPGRHRTIVEPSRLYCESPEMCCGEHSRHEITMDGVTRPTHCVLDTLLLALVEDADSASVRSFSPPTQEVVTLSIGRGGLVADPPGAVMSFGMRTEGEGTIYETLCPYVNAFPSEDAYRHWAEATPRATTVAMPFDQAWAFARDLLGTGSQD